MDGVKMARIRLCHRCEHMRTAPVWRWPRCTADGTEKVELSDKFMEAGTCPLGLWQGLDPVELAAERADHDAVLRRRNSRAMAPVLDAALSRMTDASDKGAFLVDLVAAGALRRDVAEERAIAEGLDLDAP